MNRWLVVAGAILIQLALGALYAWSVFTDILTNPDGVYGFSAKETMGIFSVCLAVFAIVMVIAGRWQAKTGPRLMSILGGLLLGLGFILAGLFGDSFWAQVVFIGVVAGTGIGMAYVVPIAVGVKWFPDKKGMITGLAVAGFGFGATIWVKMADSWFGGLLNTTQVFGLPNVQSVFFIYGIVYIVLVFIGSLVMVNPPEGYKPAGWEPKQAVAGSPLGEEGFTPGQMLRTPQFYAIWSVFGFSALAGLMVISCIKLFGIDVLVFRGFEEANAGIIAGTAMAWYAIFNGLGRILWGMISDRLGRKSTIVLMSALQGVVMLVLYYGVSVGLATGLIIGAILVGFNYGGIFALFPAITADFFGNKQVGINYGWVFSAYGIAGISGPLIAGIFKDAASSGASPTAWLPPFIIAGVACLLGALIMALTKAPAPLSEKKTEKPELVFK